MKLPRLIGLYSPAPGCGKSTVANLLTEHRTVSIAAPLKCAVSNMLHDLGIPDFTYAYPNKEAIIPELGVSARHMMQTLGTEWGRACIHPDFWVMIARAKVQRIMNDGRSVVIDDVRLPNEAAMVFELGGELWRIDRPGVTYNGDHSSEGGLEDITPDRRIMNDGTITQLKEKIAEQQHRATPEQWASVKALAFGGVAYSCILELLHRIKALEATQQAHDHPLYVIDPERQKMAQESSQAAGFAPRWPEVELRAATTAQPNHPEIPGGWLIGRIKSRLIEGVGSTWEATSASVLFEVAAWLDTVQKFDAAVLLRQEAER